MCDLCLFSYPDVCFLSRYVMFNIFLSIFVCAAAGLFFACPCFRAVCHCWKYAWVVDLSLQACPSVTFEDSGVLSECCPSDRDSSLNLLFLCFVSGAVSLFQVDVALTLSIWMLLTYIGVSFSIITFVFDVFIFRSWFPVPSGNLCSICCSSGGVFVYMNTSSAKITKIFNVYLEASALR